MKVMFSAGEASGDTHAASVAKALKELYPEVEMLGMGGSLMAKAGVKIVYDIKDLGFIGAVEIIKAIPFFFKLRGFIRNIMIKEKPDVFVCVDYPGFNMRLAKVAHELGIPVIYYIAPTIWAWHRSRGKDIAKYVTKVASIFPFEAKAYEEFGCDVEFVGHPLLDIVKPTLSREESYEYFKASKEDTNILLMPGSRKQEVMSLLDTMLIGAEDVVKQLNVSNTDAVAKLDRSNLKEATNGKNLHFWLPRANTIDKTALENIISHHNLPVTITEEKTYDLMQICDICLAASGTATLETALMNLPTVLLYRLSPVTFFLGKILVHLNYVGLPNIVAGREVIPELLQNDVTPENISKLLYSLITDKEKYTVMKEDLAEVRAKLGDGGAVKKVAQLIASVALTEDVNGKL